VAFLKRSATTHSVLLGLPSLDTRSTLKLLQDMLREHKIRKTYAAIVKGQVSLDKQLIMTSPEVSRSMR
jgi:hypothetical protein